MDTQPNDLPKTYPEPASWDRASVVEKLTNQLDNHLKTEAFRGDKKAKEPMISQLNQSLTREGRVWGDNRRRAGGKHHGCVDPAEHRRRTLNVPQRYFAVILSKAKNLRSGPR